MQGQAAGRVALVAGATGLVGRAVLAALLADKRYREVHVVGRREPSLTHPKLHCHRVDFAHLGKLPEVDDVYVALGTTIKVAGNQQAFRAIDFDAVVAVAKAAKVSGATKLGVVSAMGANAKSSVFYNRVKGEMEDALSRLGYASLIVARPSILEGDRNSLQQPGRSGEGLALMAMRLLRPLLPANYRAIDAQRVAQALVQAVQDATPGMRVLLSGELQTHAA